MHLENFSLVRASRTFDAEHQWPLSSRKDRLSENLSLIIDGPHKVLVSDRNVSMRAPVRLPDHRPRRVLETALSGTNNRLYRICVIRLIGSFHSVAPRPRKGPFTTQQRLNKAISRRRGCGKVGIPRFLRDFQARWESLALWTFPPRVFSIAFFAAAKLISHGPLTAQT